jgi:CubicO group peptidase (beta-lactamase class C family)
MNPNLALRNFALRLPPTDSELGAAESHFATIKSRLADSLDLARILRIGSHARGTAIGTYSDVDILAVLPRSQARWGNRWVRPETYIGRVADDLRDRYTSTGIRRDGQAVVLNFRGGQQAVDVVPGIFLGFEGARPIYFIPGSAGEWIRTSPERHNRFFKLADHRAGGKLRRVSQMIKAWRYARDPPFPISSFFTDMLLASTNIASGVKSYSQCLDEFFSELIRRKGRGLRDPEGIAGVIDAADSAPGLFRLENAALAAREHSSAALYAEARGKFEESRRQWGVVFRQRI